MAELRQDNAYAAVDAHTNGPGKGQLSHTFAMIDALPVGRQEVWQDSPEGWPQSPTYSRWGGPQDIAKLYGETRAGKPPAPLIDYTAVEFEIGGLLPGGK